MALFQQIAGVFVVGAEHAPLGILVAQQGEQRIQVPGGGALPDHDELAPFQLGDGIVQVMALMVGVDAGGDVGVEVVAHQIGGVAVDFLMMGLGRHDLLHTLLVSGNGAYKVHHLRQALDPGMVIEGVNCPVVQHGTGLVQRGGRHTGGQHEPHIHRQTLGGLEHVLNAVGAHDVGDLVGVRHHGGGAVGQHGPDKLLGGHQGALQMDMGIQKTGKDDLSGHIHFLGSAVLAHAYDQPLRHGDVGGAELI